MTKPSPRSVTTISIPFQRTTTNTRLPFHFSVHRFLLSISSVSGFRSPSTLIPQVICSADPLKSTGNRTFLSGVFSAKMDLGCLDLGCLDAVNKHCKPHCSSGSDSAGSDFSETGSTSASKFGKKSSPRSGQPTNALNKLTSQIKKPTRSKTSPTNWIPRKKGDTYLKRKIQMLQEFDGMKQTLDETLEDSNPHYCRVLREKIAARDAARKVMEAQKAALVEASWCRILKAARIQSKEAEDLLFKAEKAAAEAFEAARDVGVTMDDMPNFPHSQSISKPSAISKARSAAHSVGVSFESAFEVDKEVAAAVKTAFMKLANCAHSNEDEFKDLLQKISQNPETRVGNQELTECSSESEPDSGFKAKAAAESNESIFRDSRKRRHKKRQSFELVNIMLNRLKSLKEDELSSLATIVATCGLNAALAEIESTKHIANETPNVPQRLSSVDAPAGHIRKKQPESELPSLDKFLVKHMSKLEKEVEQAKSNRKKELDNASAGKPQLDDKNLSTCEAVPDLGSILVKNSSRFEREIQEAKKNSAKDFQVSHKKPASCSDSSSEVIAEVPSLDKCLVKHVSKLEKEVQEAKNRRKEADKENVNINRESKLTSQEDSLEKILIKPGIHGLQREKMQSKCSKESEYGKMQSKQQHNNEGGEGLDKVLIKHVSKLEREKLEWRMKEEEGGGNVQRSSRKMELQRNNNEEGSLDQILVKHKSRLEREKTMSSGFEDRVTSSSSLMSRRQAREKELKEAWDGLSFGNSMKPHLSKLEKEKAAWIKAEEEERRQVL
ncbi:hypothetical protein LINGRAHAP2_LOCUS35702 [Linum grandiflorum]